MRARVLFTLCLITAVAGGAWSATITVDTLVPGVANDGSCSLIEAIENANADAAVHADCPAGSGADVIELGIEQTYTLVAAYGVDNGLPEITSEITINGHGSTIERDLLALDEFRILSNSVTGTLALNELTLSNGLLTGPGGGIYNQGSLSLDHCTVTNNRAGFCAGLISYGGTVVAIDSTVGGNTATVSYGGGLCNSAETADATMTLIRTRVDSNTAQGTSGAGMGAGGILTSTTSGRRATLIVTESTVSGNTAPSVPGILQNFFGTYSDAHSTLVIDRCVISDNAADPGSAYGAGLFSVARDGLETVADITDSEIVGNTGGNGGGIEAYGGAELTITGSSIHDNLAADSTSGGILVVQDSHLHLERSAVHENTVDGATVAFAGGIGVLSADATIRNSTVSGNASNHNGGGIWACSSLDFGGYPATVDISDSTIAGNTAVDSGGGIRAVRVSGSADVLVSLHNTVVAENYEGVDGTVLGNCSIDATASVTSLGFNLSDDSTCNLVHADDLIVPDAMLAPLAPCGPAPSHMCHLPQEGSPTIDSGDDANCPAMDQLGNLRPWDGDGDGVAHCDRGAIELGAPFFLDGFEDGTTNGWSSSTEP